MSWLCAAILLGGSSIGAASARAQGTSVVRAYSMLDVVDTSRRDTSPLDRRITLDLHAVTLDTVLAEIQAKSGVQLIFNSRVVPVSRAVSIAIVNGTVRQALAMALAGTDIVAKLSPSGAIMLARASLTDHGQQTTGTVTGMVLDSATRKGVPSATVRVNDTKLSVLTNDMGHFTITGVPTGSRIISVRVLGYASDQRRLDVVERGPTTTTFVLHATPTVLSGVVTMGNGEQRRIEVPNDITTINVDSVRGHAAINTVTDLLATRVPGLTVTPASGAVGAPAKIRIRGISSINGSNDPVVYLDGVRVPGPTTGTSVLGTDLTSRLNDLDVNNIESIEVLKGPSAAALYGTDAGNGVIIIKTKHARPGVTRWNFDGSYATMNVPNQFPEVYTSYGRDATSLDPRICTPVLYILGQCVVQDSVRTYDIFKDPRFTTLGSGNSQAYSFNVSTGQSNVQYSMTGSFNDAVGAAQLPEFTQQMLAAKYGQVPGWMRRPNTQKTYSLGANISAQPWPTATVGFVVNGSQLETRNSGDGVRGAAPAPGDTLTFAQSTLFNNRKEQSVSHIMTGLSPAWNPTAWFQMSGSFGANLVATTGTQTVDSRYSLLPVSTTASNSLDTEKETDFSYSGNLQSSLRIPLTSRLTSSTTLAGDYQRDNASSTTALANGIPIESEDPSLASLVSSMQSSLQSARLGWSISEELSFVERLFLSASVRGDRANTFGTNAKHPIFPQWGASWLALAEAPDLPIVHAINSLRLRVSYGMAANQPGPLDALANFQSAIFTYNGADQAVLLPSTIGNSALLPEKNTEIETGMDIELFNSRASITATYSRKLSKNALVTRAIAPSAGPSGSGQVVNVGSVLNGSYELTLGATVLDSRMLTWRLNTSAYATRNKLVSLGPGAQAFGTNTQRYVVGYPIDGTWVQPLLGYADLDGDGLLLSPGELIYGDSVVYAGWPMPKYTINYNNSFGLFNNALSFDCNFDFQDGLTQTAAIHDLQAMADLTTPLAIQAAAQGSGTVTVSALRWQNATLSWNMPVRTAQMLRARSARLSFSGTNLGLWSRYKGADPTISTAIGGEARVDGGVLPPTRNWTLRLSLGF